MKTIISSELARIEVDEGKKEILIFLKLDFTKEVCDEILKDIKEGLEMPLLVIADEYEFIIK